uniref:Aspartyl beta-hydroxylase/Triadin domain-containing protein n=1 Tax=Amphiprion percula TaxID=161767 RepID=A0A3P8SKL2_AMPPE
MGDPATLVESTTPPVTTGPTMIAGEMQVEEPARSRPADQTAEEDKAAWRSWWGPGGWFQDGAKAQSANKNGKKVDSGSSSSSFFTWFIVLALLGVWTSVAVVYFDLVDYQGVLDKAKGLQINLSEALQGKLVAYDTDGDGDFDVEDAKVLLGLTSEGDGQGETEVLDWLEEVEEGGSDWLNGFFTFLYGLINPLEPLEKEEEEERGSSGGVVEVQEEDDEDEGSVRRRGAKDDGNRGQKIVIVGLHNQ